MEEGEFIGYIFVAFYAFAIKMPGYNLFQFSITFDDCQLFSEMKSIILVLHVTRFATEMTFLVICEDGLFLS